MIEDKMENNCYAGGDDEPVDARAHKNLLQAISGLGKVQHIKRTTRNESERQPDEFHLVKNGYLNKDRQVPAAEQAVGINDIVRVLKDTGRHLQVGRNLKNVATTTKVVPVPLEKPAAERIKRTIGYDSIKKKLARWDAVVAKNRSSETQVFPLPTGTVFIDTSAHAKPLQLAVKSDLVLEMEATEAKLAALRRERSGDMRDPKDVEAEEQRQLKIKLTRDELIARRKELAYLKMRQSQKSAKARLQNNIKSKKYRRLLKRQKMQQQVKEFEMLQKTNPEAALEKLNMLEKNRVMERANLRHKNTGTWAKNLQIRAKYDKDVRKDLAEQLEISRQLTQKTQDSEEDEDRFDGNDVTEKSSNETMNPISEEDAFNPWMRVQKSNSKNSTSDNNTEANYRKYWLERNVHKKQMEKYKEELEEDSHNVKESIEKEGETETRTKPQLKTKRKNKPNKVVIENGWVVEEIVEAKNNVDAINIDDIFDAEEDRQQHQLSQKLKTLSRKVKRLSKVKDKKKQSKKERDELKQLTDLTFKDTAKRPILDEALITDQNEVEEENAKRLKEMVESGNKTSSINTSAPSTIPQEDVIDPTKIAPIQLKQSFRDLAGIEAADYDDDAAIDSNLSEQQITISQAFVDDDIVADFSKDKSEKSKQTDVELQLSMPGWGSWAGAGISQESAAAAQKNKRLILKLAPEEKRRDQNKGTVYINEEASKSLRSHLVSDLPFPFTSLKDYEASIRAPIGRNFVPETAFRLLTRPAVITRKGAIIEPMDESELLKPPAKPRNVVEKRIMATAAK